MATQNRLDWVDIAKALSITLVVMMYATYSVGEAVGASGLLHWFVGFTTPLRMPEFFLISGLFLSRGISRDWRSYADRRVVHYLYFFVLWSVILIALKIAIFAGQPALALGYLLASPYAPFSALWFIYALALYSVAAKLLHDFKVPVWLILIAGAILNLVPLPSGSNSLIFLGELADYFIFFFAGYIFAPRMFSLANALIAKPLFGVAVLAVWALVNASLVFSSGFELTPTQIQMGWASSPLIRLPLAFSGAVAVCLAAGLLSRTLLSTPLAYMGARVLAIYLSFLIPMGIAREILLRIGVADPTTLSVLVILASIAGPLVVEAIIAKTGWGPFLFARPAWAHIGPSSTKSKPASVPAE